MIIRRDGQIYRPAFISRNAGCHLVLPSAVEPRARLSPFQAPFSHISSPIHTICTTSAPCVRRFQRLPSQKASKMRQNSLRNPASNAHLRKNPQENPCFSHFFLHERRINRGIRTANTICCALYLTHPTEGVTFTTATPQDIPFAVTFYRSSAADALPAGFNHAPPKRRNRLKNRARTHRTP
jgi:hypothetical protein